MRLNRYLALCGLGSRRAVEDLIRAGMVRVNGEEAGLAVDVADSDCVEVHGRPVSRPERHAYLLFHKPTGCVCSRGDTHGRTTVYDFLPPDMGGLHYVGRLDMDSRGLLFFTSDGALTQALTHPSREVLRVYSVHVADPLTEDDLRALLRGVEVEPGVVFKCASAVARGGAYELGLREGKKREIRRLLASLGHAVVDLKRISFGGVELGKLPEGAHRPLSTSELETLRAAAGLDGAVPVPARSGRVRDHGSRRARSV